MTDIVVAIAILTQGDRVLMQLRDDIPNIIYPGCWGFFGGHLEVDETPEVAVVREILEEINYAVPINQMTLFGNYGDRRKSGEYIQRHVFTVPLIVPITALSLNEGWDMNFLTRQNAEEGGAYSAQAGQWRPIPAIHQQILKDFFDSVEK